MSVPGAKPSVVVALVALANAVWVMVGLARVPKGPVSASGEVAPSASVGMLMGPKTLAEVKAPEPLKTNEPDPTTVVAPVPPVISADGTVTAYVQVFAPVLVYVTERLCAVPSESNTGRGALVVVPPTTVVESRLAVIPAVVLATAGIVTPVPTCNGCKAAEVLTIPPTAG